MRLIKHIIFTKLEDGKYLMINSLNGLIDKVNTDIYTLINGWMPCDEIIPSTEIEEELLNSLKTRGYIVSCAQEELEQKEAILSKLRKNHAEDKMKCKMIVLVLTYDCNFRCPYCFESGNVSKGTMTISHIDAVLEAAGDSCEDIVLFGGEPLLIENKDLIEYIFKKEADKTFSAYTNGYYLEEFCESLSMVKIGHITVTLDGSEKAHDCRRFLSNGGGTFKKIMRGIAKCLKNGIKINIRMNVDESNVDDCNTLRTSLMNEFSEYNDFLSFELASMLSTAYKDRVGMTTSLFKDDKDLTVEKRVQRNKLIASFSPVTNVLL